jgi:hypothetical protein
VRGNIDSGILYLTNFFLFASLLFTGCGAKLIQTIPASPQEELTVSVAFQDMLENQANCGCCLDAEADATISAANWLGERSGTMTGFLQAMQPSYIKFVGVNPLGQPLVVFITDGITFQNLQVPNSKVYQGDVRSAAFNRYMPVWFEPENGFYWLAGRIKPRNFEVVDIRRDKEKKDFWVQLHYAGSQYRDMVLFDPHESVVLRHILIDNQERPHIDAQYADYQPLIDETVKDADKGTEQKHDTGESVSCRLPGSIRLVSHNNSGQINLQLHSFLPGSEFAEEDFTIDIPSGFERVQVK